LAAFVLRFATAPYACAVCFAIVAGVLITAAAIVVFADTTPYSSTVLFAIVAVVKITLAAVVFLSVAKWCLFTVAPFRG
jgi:uncharacterized membrane protein